MYLRDCWGKTAFSDYSFNRNFAHGERSIRIIRQPTFPATVLLRHFDGQVLLLKAKWILPGTQPWWIWFPIQSIPASVAQNHPSISWHALRKQVPLECPGMGRLAWRVVAENSFLLLPNNLGHRIHASNRSTLASLARRDQTFFTIGKVVDWTAPKSIKKSRR